MPRRTGQTDTKNLVDLMTKDLAAGRGKGGGGLMARGPEERRCAAIFQSIRAGYAAATDRCGSQCDHGGSPRKAFYISRDTGRP